MNNIQISTDENREIVIYAYKDDTGTEIVRTISYLELIKLIEKERKE